MNIVEKKFEHRATIRVGLLLFAKPIAIEFIEECQKLNIGILGIDGFILLGENTQPSMNNSVDYSQMQESEGIHQKAINFLKSQNANLHFEIVCND